MWTQLHFFSHLLHNLWQIIVFNLHSEDCFQGKFIYFSHYCPVVCSLLLKKSFFSKILAVVGLIALFEAQSICCSSWVGLHSKFPLSAHFSFTYITWTRVITFPAVGAVEGIHKSKAKAKMSLLWRQRGIFKKQLQMLIWPLHTIYKIKERRAENWVLRHHFVMLFSCFGAAAGFPETYRWAYSS